MIIFRCVQVSISVKPMPALYSLYREKRVDREVFHIGYRLFDNYRSHVREELQLFVKFEEQEVWLHCLPFSQLFLPMDPAKEEGYPQPANVWLN